MGSKAGLVSAPPPRDEELYEFGVDQVLENLRIRRPTLFCFARLAGDLRSKIPCTTDEFLVQCQGVSGGENGNQS